MPRGRPPKPTAQLKIAGTYRADRHGGRAQAPKAGGEPARPRGLAGDARKIWDLVVPELTRNGTAARLDTFALQAMCEMWGLYRLAHAEAERGPLDKLARCAVTAYLQAWERLAAKFGLTPSDRERIRLAFDEPEEPDDLERLQRQRQGGGGA